MSQITAAPEVEIPTIPVASLAPWAIFALLFGAVIVYFISGEQGAVSVFSGNAVHEWVHDGRHILGFPCH